MRDKNTLEYANWLGLYYLGFRAHTRGQMLEKLKNKGVSNEVCQQALMQFEEQGYINDFEYAVDFIKSAARNKKDGAMKIRHKLREKRIDAEIIDAAFASADADFSGSLERAIETKARSLDLRDRKERDKLIAYLSRKGFKMQEILPKLEVIFDE